MAASPKDVALRRALSLALLQTGELAAARTEIEAGLTAAPGNLDLLTLLAVAQLMTGDNRRRTRDGLDHPRTRSAAALAARTRTAAVGATMHVPAADISRLGLIPVASSGSTRGCAVTSTRRGCRPRSAGETAGRSGVLAPARFADVENHRPIDPSTVYRIYSMTKPVTTLAALMLYEDGHFQLDQPVADFIPSFAGLRVWAGEDHALNQTAPLARP